MPKLWKILALLGSTALAFLVVVVAYGIVSYEPSQLRVDRLRDQLADLEREHAAVQAALADLERAKADVDRLENDIAELRLRFPCEIAIVSTAEDIFELAKTSDDLELVVAAQEGTIDREFWFEHEFRVFFHTVSKADYVDSLDRLNSSQKPLGITHGTLLYDLPEPFDVHITVSAYTDRCDR
jgi:Tfp pilus assembly protein PilO